MHGHDMFSASEPQRGIYKFAWPSFFFFFFFFFFWGGGGGGVKNLNFNNFLVFSEKCIIFGHEDFVDFLWSSQNWTCFRGHFYVLWCRFLKSRYRMGIFLCLFEACLIFLIFLFGKQSMLCPSLRIKNKLEYGPPPPTSRARRTATLFFLLFVV